MKEPIRIILLSFRYVIGLLLFISPGVLIIYTMTDFNIQLTIGICSMLTLFLFVIAVGMRLMDI
jgi:hypothetical protein